MKNISILWFRRDLRLDDNTALHEALKGGKSVLPIFIFDEFILNELPVNDPRVTFIYDNLQDIDQKLKALNSSILCLKGTPVEIWKKLIKTYSVHSVFVNKDYEPYARKRDNEVAKLLVDNDIEFLSFKDQVIHEENEVLKKDGTPYTVFTPYSNKWLEIYEPKQPLGAPAYENFHQEIQPFPTLESLGFKPSNIKVHDYDLSQTHEYHKKRDFPHMDATSYLSAHLRFGTVGIRTILAQLKKTDSVFLKELIWREFFMQILFHFPKVVTQNFKAKYDNIQWLNNENDFKKWCDGNTGYPMVDAGMRQLNQTGYMHNRVRMITAGFLCKHLLIDWKWGETYFASKLLDYELSSNNGNWQWAAGTGCDAAPYFRIFNPMEQLKKFDKNHHYVKKWIPELGTDSYPQPIVEHTFARKRALEVYNKGLKN